MRSHWSPSFKMDRDKNFKTREVVPRRRRSSTALRAPPAARLTRWRMTGASALYLQGEAGQVAAGACERFSWLYSSDKHLSSRHRPRRRPRRLDVDINALKNDTTCSICLGAHSGGPSPPLPPPFFFCLDIAVQLWRPRGRAFVSERARLEREGARVGASPETLSRGERDKEDEAAPSARRSHPQHSDRWRVSSQVLRSVHREISASKVRFPLPLKMPPSFCEFVSSPPAPSRVL